MSQQLTLGVIIGNRDFFQIVWSNLHGLKSLNYSSN